MRRALLVCLLLFNLGASDPGYKKPALRAVAFQPSYVEEIKLVDALERHYKKYGSDQWTTRNWLQACVRAKARAARRLGTYKHLKRQITIQAAESDFNPNAIGRYREIGMDQINPNSIATARRVMAAAGIPWCDLNLPGCQSLAGAAMFKAKMIFCKDDPFCATKFYNGHKKAAEKYRDRVIKLEKQIFGG